MLTGNPPFPSPASVMQKTAKRYTRLKDAVPGISLHLDALIDDALEPDPEKRVASAQEFWDRLAGNMTPPQGAA